MAVEEKAEPSETTEIASTPKTEEPLSAQASAENDSSAAQSPQSLLQKISVMKCESFVGPLPPPSILKGYNDIITDGALRILVMAEKQQKHRMAMEDAVVKSDIRRADSGLHLGFIISVMLALGGMYLIAIGKSVSGLVVVLVQIASIAGIFVYSHRVRKEERTEKQKESTHPSNKQQDEGEKK